MTPATPQSTPGSSPARAAARRRRRLRSRTAALLLVLIVAGAAATPAAPPEEEAAARFTWVAPEGWTAQARTLNRLASLLVEGPGGSDLHLVGAWSDTRDGRFRLRRPTLQLWFEPLADRKVTRRLVSRQARGLARAFDAMLGGDLGSLQRSGRLDPARSRFHHDAGRHLLVLDLLVEDGTRQTRVVEALLFARDGVLRASAEVPGRDLGAAGPDLDDFLAALAVVEAHAPGGPALGGLSWGEAGALAGALVGLLVGLADLARRRPLLPPTPRST